MIKYLGRQPETDLTRGVCEDLPEIRGSIGLRNAARTKP